MLSGPSFPGKLFALQDPLLGKPSLTAGPLPSRQAHTAPCTWLPRPSGSCEFPTAQRAPLRRGRRKHLACLPHAEGAWYLLAACLYEKLLAALKACLPSGSPSVPVPVPGILEVLSKQSCNEIDSRNSYHPDCIFLQVTRPAFQCSLVPETPTYPLSSCATFVPPSPLVLC